MLAAEPSLALSVFRLKHSHASSAIELNELNRVFYGRICARHDIMLTQTMLDGLDCIRFNVGATRTENKHIDQAIQLLLCEGRIAISEWEEARKPGETLPN